MSLVGAAEAAAIGWETMTSDTASGFQKLTAGIGIASSALMAFGQTQQALSFIPGMGGIKGVLISAGLTIGSMLIKSVGKAIDDAMVSTEEHIQNLQDSNNNLNQATQNTKAAIETVQTQNENYLEGIKKIQSFDQDPTTLAEDIFESNKKALGLINKYGLKSEDYTTESNGLIKINEDILKQQEQKAKDVAESADFANILGQALNEKVGIQTEQRALRSQIHGVSIHGQNNGNIFDFMSKAGVQDKEGKLFFDDYKKIYEGGNWEEFRQIMKNNPNNRSLDNFEKYMELESKSQSADFGIENASRVLANKMLGEAGYNTQTQEGYTAIAEVAAKNLGTANRKRIPQ